MDNKKNRDIDRRKEVRFPSSIQVGFEKSSQVIFGQAKDCSHSGLRAIFDNFEYKPYSRLNLKIQKPNQDSFVSTAAQVRWMKPTAGRYEVGFRLKDFFLQDFFPAAKPGVLEGIYKKREWLNYLTKVILLVIAAFMIWHFIARIVAVNRIQLMKLIRPQIFKVNMIWDSLRGNFSEKIPKILKKQTYKVDGIAYSADDSESFVIINDNVYYPNEVVSGGKIVNISQDEVTIKFREKEVVYGVGDKIASN